MNQTRSERNPSYTKRGPGRKAHASANDAAPRTAAAPRMVVAPPRWRQGEPLHIVKPVRAAKHAARRASEIADEIIREGNTL